MIDLPNLSAFAAVAADPRFIAAVVIAMSALVSLPAFDRSLR